MPPRIPADESRAFALGLHDLMRKYQFQDLNGVCEFGITLTECHALEVVTVHGPVPVSSVARRLGVDKSTASRTLAALEEKGLVRRAGEPEDKRVANFAATPLGKTRSQAILNASANRVAAALEGFSVREREAALEILRRLSTTPIGDCDGC